MIETLHSFEHVDFDDQDKMFEAVLASLNDEIKVYPSEGYYYFWFHHHGNLMSGNIRFDYNLRKEGRLSFVYYYNTTHGDVGDYLNSKIFEPSEDFSLTPASDDNVYTLRYKNRTIRVVLPIPVSTYEKRENEVHVGDMFDESGIVFSMVFNETANHFFYVLDRSKDYEYHEDISDALSIGARSGFVFYNRGKDKILVGVKVEEVEGNTFYDGPFDQLPEHNLEAANFKSLAEKAYPQLGIEIDDYGYYQGLDGMRLAVANYIIYQSLSQFDALNICPDAKLQNRCVQDFINAN